MNEPIRALSPDELAKKRAAEDGVLATQNLQRREAGAISPEFRPVVPSEAEVSGKLKVVPKETKAAIANMAKSNLTAEPTSNLAREAAATEMRERLEAFISGDDPVVGDPFEASNFANSASELPRDQIN